MILIRPRLRFLYPILTIIIFINYLSCISNCHYIKQQNTILEKCNDGFQEMANCLQFKALKMIDQLILTKKPIAVGNLFYVTDININNNNNQTNDIITDDEILAQEEDLESGKISENLTELLISRIVNVAKAKSIQFDLDTDLDEGRKKKEDKKGKGMMMMMMMMGAGVMMMHKAFGLIGLIAAKALIIAKIALVISGIIALKKLMSKEDDDSSSHQAQVIYAKADPHASGGSGGGGGGGSSGWQRRSIIDHSHNMAYAGQIPTNRSQ